jgi:hypothetical protein
MRRIVLDAGNAVPGDDRPVCEIQNSSIDTSLIGAITDLVPRKDVTPPF